MAARYLIPGGNGNWNSPSNWSTTSGGSAGVSFPVAGDDVIFDVNSANANITINVASACATLTCSDYTGNLTFSTQLTTTGNLVFSTGMTTSGVSGLILGNGAYSITSNGVVLRTLFLNNFNPTITLNDNLSITSVVKAGFSSTFIFNSSGGLRSIFCSGGLICGAGNITTDADTAFVFNGTGIITGVGFQQYNLVINTSGTITFSGTMTFLNRIITYTSGTVVTTGSSITFNTTTFNGINPITWDSVTFSGTITLNDKLNANSITVNANLDFVGTEGWECNTFNLGTSTNLGRTITLLAGNTYRVNNDFNSIRSTNSSRAVLQSSDAVNMAYFTCGAGCVMNVGYTNAVRIDSSLGKQVYSFNGVYTTAINWSNTFPVSVAYAYQS